MPVRGGRSGGGSRGGFRPRVTPRAPRSSSSGSSGIKGFRINPGGQAPRSAAEGAGSTNPVHRNPFRFRPGWWPGSAAGSGLPWKIIGLIVGILAFGACSCVGLGLLLQALGYGR